MEKDKEVLLSAKVKAQMLGDDDITLDLNDQLTDKDWTLYAEGPEKDGVVVFFIRPGNGGGNRSSCVWDLLKRKESKRGWKIAVGAAALDGRAASPMGRSVTQREHGWLEGPSWDGKVPQRNGLVKTQSPLWEQSQLGGQSAVPPLTDAWTYGILTSGSVPPGRSEGMFSRGEVGEWHGCYLLAFHR
jgi:hypothetical protein